MNLEVVAKFVETSLLTAIVLLGVARVLLPKEERPRLKLPAVLILLHLCLQTAKFFVPESFGSAKKFLDLCAFLLILLSMGRSGFLIVIHSVLSQRLARPLPKIIRDIIQGTIYIVALLFTLQAAGLEPGSLLTTSALLTAVIGLSLQDTLGNLFAGLAIQAQRPFEVGDWIQYDSEESNVGMVVEINWRAVRVRTLQRVEITVPNNLLARAPIRNFTRPQVEARRDIECFAPYSTPPRQVTTMLLKAVRDVPGVLQEPPPSVIPHGFHERGVTYSIRYFVTDFKRREYIDGHVRERIWYALSRAEIDIPAPQRTVHIHESTQKDREERERRQIEARARYLRKVDFLEGIPEEALVTLARMSETRLYDAEEAIIRQGDEDEEFFIVQRGRVAIEVDKRRQGTLRVAQLGPGQFFGEMSLMTGERRRATVRAVDECQLLVVGKVAFNRVFDDRPDLVARISDVLSKREAQLGEIEERTTTVEEDSERSAELLERIRDFFSL